VRCDDSSINKTALLGATTFKKAMTNCADRILSPYIFFDFIFIFKDERKLTIKTDLSVSS